MNWLLLVSEQICVLEHGDRLVLGKGFLVSGQSFSQSLQIKRVQELWEGTGLPVRLRSWYRWTGSLFRVPAALQGANEMGGNTCSDARHHLCRWMITQRQFYHFATSVSNKQPRCVGWFKGLLLCSTLELERGSQMRTDWGHPTGRLPWDGCLQQMGPISGWGCCSQHWHWVWKDAEVKYKTPSTAERLM